MILTSQTRESYGKIFVFVGKEKRKEKEKKKKIEEEEEEGEEEDGVHIIYDRTQVKEEGVPDKISKNIVNPTILKIVVLASSST
jgi:hypothetical protein